MSIHGFVDQNGQIQKYDYADLENKPTIPAEVLIDNTLTEEGQAADAKAVGDALSSVTIPIDDTLSDSSTNPVQNKVITGALQNAGLSEAFKNALLNVVRHSAIIDGDGELYYQSLYDALYPPQNLVSISAVYTQTGEVYDTESLNDLKSDLTVIALWNDASTSEVTTYVLSGSLVAGTSTILVSYGGKSTTFTVVVTHDDTNEWDYIWKYQDGLPPVSDWSWATTGGSGHIRTIVSDGLKMACKHGLTATYYMPYIGSSIASAGGGVAEFKFYFPAVQTNKLTSDYYFRVAISDGTNTLAVKLTHPKNLNNVNNIYLHTPGSGIYLSPDLLRSFSINESLVIRLEMDSTNLVGNVYINGVLEAENIDLTTISDGGTSVQMHAGGSTVDDAANGPIIQYVKVKYGLDEN